MTDDNKYTHTKYDPGNILKNIDDALEKKKWISVKDRLPDTKGYYLCTYIFYNHRFYYDRFFDTEDKKFQTTDKITHWMPLPELPEDENE